MSGMKSTQRPQQKQPRSGGYTSQTASRLFLVFSFSVAWSRPHIVSSSYGFDSLRAVVLTPQQQQQ